MNVDERELFESENHERSIEKERKSRKIKPIDLLPQFLASFLMYLPVIQAGINMSFASVLITQLADDQEIEIDRNSASIIGSIWSMALPLGAISSGFLMDKFGRKKIGFLICVPFFIAWTLVGLTKSITMIYVARILAGICCGLTTSSVVYTAEISHKTFRSALLCMNSVLVSFGIFLTYLLNYFHLHWRFIGWIYAIMSLISMLLITFVPQSPHWILFFNKNSSEEKKLYDLKKTLSWLYRNPEIARVQYDDIVTNYRDKLENGLNQNEKINWIQSIKKPQVYKPLTILLILFMLQQLSGGYVLIFYTINIFRNLGSDFVTIVDENLASLLLGSIRLIMAIIAAFLSQQCNRKTLLYISTLGMTFFAFASSIKMKNIDQSGHFLFLKQTVSNSTISYENESSSALGNYFLLTCILAYILFASLGLLIIPWTCIAELFSIQYKATFGGLTIALAYIFMFIVLKIFPFALEKLTISIIFSIFGTSSLLCCIFVYFYLPETHRRTFVEIENHFLGKISI